MPPAETPRRCPLPVCMVFAPHCRAGPWPRRTDDFSKNNFIRFGGRCARRRVSEANRRAAAALRPEIERPPYRVAETGNFPANPAWGQPLPGGIYASPTNTRYRVYDPRDRAAPQTPTGRMHAAPTNLPERGCLPNRHQPSGRFARPRSRAGFQNGSPDEPFRQERNGIVTESLCLVRNVNRLGRPHQTSGVSKGARRPLWPCPAPRN